MVVVVEVVVVVVVVVVLVAVLSRIIEKDRILVLVHFVETE